jgi:hypothetical protein
LFIEDDRCPSKKGESGVHLSPPRNKHLTTWLTILGGYMSKELLRKQIVKEVQERGLSPIMQGDADPSPSPTVRARTGVVGQHIPTKLWPGSRKSEQEYASDQAFKLLTGPQGVSKLDAHSSPRVSFSVEKELRRQKSIDAKLRAKMEHRRVIKVPKVAGASGTVYFDLVVVDDREEAKEPDYGW